MNGRNAPGRPLASAIFSGVVPSAAIQALPSVMYHTAPASQATIAAITIARQATAAKVILYVLTIVLLGCAGGSILHASHAADYFPLLRRDRLHGEAGIFDQRHVLEARVGLDRGQRHRLRKRLHRLHVERLEDALL